MINFRSLRFSFNSSYLRSIQVLAYGSILAQLITFAVSPITTRLYTSEQLGVYTLLLTFVSLFSPVICGRYDLSIVTAKEDDVFALVKGSVFVTVIFTIISSTGFYIYLIFNEDVLERIGLFALFLVPILLLVGLQNIMTAYNNRMSKYKLISSVYVVRTLIQNFGLVIFGIFGFADGGLFFSKFLSDIAGLKRQSKDLIIYSDHIKSVPSSRILEILKLYRAQLLYSTPAMFVNSFSHSILSFMIISLFGLKLFGLYSITFRILGIPLLVISNNISKVFFQQASESKRRSGEYKNSLVKNSLFLIALSIPMVVVFLLFAPQLFAFVFGSEWSLAGEFAKILAPMYGIRLIVSALTPSLMISGKQKQELFLQTLFILVGIIAYFLSLLGNHTLEYFLTLISIGYSIVYLLFYVYIYNLSKEKTYE